MTNIKVSLGISNYYGEVVAYEEGGKHFIELENWDGAETKEISKEFYDAIIKEFK